MDSNESVLKECRKFTDHKIAHFFYKNKNYVMITESMKIYMCNRQKSEEECEVGNFKSTWKIKNLALEENKLLMNIYDGDAS